LKAKEYVAKYFEYVKNPPTVYRGQPEGTPPPPPEEAALVRILMELVNEGDKLLEARCGKNRTVSASNNVLKELEKKFEVIRRGIGNIDIKPSAFRGFLKITQPGLYETYMHSFAEAKPDNTSA
jgi:hypothetical protein